MIEQKFKILIVEDELLIAKDIAARLHQVGYEICGIADNYNTALSMFNEHSPNMVLLDINIKGDKNGIDIAAEINNILPTPFIFITAQIDSKTLQKAKNTFPSAYLVKPFTTAHLVVSIDLALHNFAFQKKEFTAKESESNETDENGTIMVKQHYLFVKSEQTYVRINENNILMLEAQDNYVKIYTLEKSYTIRCTINKAIEKMKQDNFIRVHRSFCININKITKFNGNEITIEHLIVPLGRNYRDEFIKNFELK